MKKFASMLLAIFLMFTLTIPSFAAESTASKNLLENVTLGLVNGILREDVSDTRAIFKMGKKQSAASKSSILPDSATPSPMKMTIRIWPKT